MSQLARTCSNPGWIRQPGEELSILEAASSVGFCANEAEVAGLIYQLVVRESLIKSMSATGFLRATLELTRLDPLYRCRRARAGARRDASKVRPKSKLHLAEGRRDRQIFIDLRMEWPGERNSPRGDTLTLLIVGVVILGFRVASYTERATRLGCCSISMAVL